MSERNEIPEAALAAFSRGWLSPEALWRVAEQWTSRAFDSLEELLSQHLSVDQMAVVFRHQTIVSDVAPEALQTMSSKIPSTTSKASSARAKSASGTSRYTLGKSLGVGGSGQVFSALDTHIQRRVALKVLKQSPNNETAEVQNRFLKEASITAQLEHPCVIPIYDLDALPDGRGFYTMRIVKSHSLREVLEARQKIQPSLPRLCALLVQVCQALAYAHSRGVVHRDLKPENILLGDYGEVYLADWGICKLMEEAEAPVVAPLFTSEEGDALNDSLHGAIAGTPGYMSPEQAMGSEVDERADLFAVGVILYEILTMRLPFPGDNPLSRMVSSIHNEPSPPRMVFKDCPLVLEALCLSLLKKKPAERPASASFVAAELESFLAGVKERQRRREQAEELTEKAKEPTQRFLVADEEREQLVGRARSLLQSIPAFEPIEKKRPAWQLEDLAAQKECEQASSAASAVLLLSQALAYDPSHTAAREGLSDIYWRLARQAENRRDESAKLLHEAKVLEYDDGRYASILRAEAWLSLQSSQPAEVLALPYHEQDRILTCGEAVSLGNTPLRSVKLIPGSYLLLLRRRGFRDTRYPIKLNRGEHHQGHVNLYNKELGAEFVYVPGGPFLMGGDIEAFDSLPRQEVLVDDYSIGRFPITFGQYLEYVQQLPEDEARRRIPYDLIDNPPLVERSPRGEWSARYEILIEGEGQRFCSKEQAAELPVFAISWFDAVAYCRWRSAKDKCLYRLPTEAEWEKAARGTDGRYFPWGDRFDALFCKMRDSRRGVTQPEPIGAFSLDESPYGVRDMAGGVRDLCADVFGSLSLSGAYAEPESSATIRVSRGGAWNTPALRCRAAARFINQAGNRYVNGGFRLVKTLTPE